ncbi:MAG: hypothetical protein F6K03_13010, partial [Kamptonema sp. SIO4C4]|nr:hypothetical protein [Kamptonema sp. SIO4C4]
FEGTVAAVLVLAGGLEALQTAAMTTALPFTFVIILVCWALVRELRTNYGPKARGRSAPDG